MVKRQHPPFPSLFMRSTAYVCKMQTLRVNGASLGAYLAVSDQQLVAAVFIQAEVVGQRERRRLVRQLLGYERRLLHLRQLDLPGKETEDTRPRASYCGGARLFFIFFLQEVKYLNERKHLSLFFVLFCSVFILI